MSQYRVVVTDQVFPSTEIERQLLNEIDAELVVAGGKVADLAAHAEEADGLLNTYLPLDRGTIAQFRRCRVIARYGIGMDNVDVQAAADAGIVVTNVPDYCVEEVATHTLALILALVRGVHEADAFVRRGGWGLDAVRPISRLSHLTVGLVGYGRIARQVAKTLATLGPRLLVHDPFIERQPDDPPFVTLEELLSTSHVVSLHAPLTAGTRGLISASTIELMRHDAVIVNTSRGGLVNLADVLAALRRRRIRGAGLDVFDPEPPDPALLAEVPGLIVTPHQAYYSEEALQESQRKAATQVIKVLTGRAPDYPVRA